jgi:hypothetical protein
MEGDGFEFLGLHVVRNANQGFNWNINTNFTAK